MSYKKKYKVSSKRRYAMHLDWFWIWLSTSLQVLVLIICFIFLKKGLFIVRLTLHAINIIQKCHLQTQLPTVNCLHCIKQVPYIYNINIFIKDKVSDVAESWVQFASKTLMPRMMHKNGFQIAQTGRWCISFPNMYDMLKAKVDR